MFTSYRYSTPSGAVIQSNLIAPRRFLVGKLNDKLKHIGHLFDEFLGA